MAKKERLVIGLTGPICGGKGTAADILKEKGFFYTLLSDQIREEIKSRGLEITREKLQETGDELRRNFGLSILAERSWGFVSSQNNSYAIIDSIRAEAEVDFLKKMPGFVLIGVTAPQELRFERAKTRLREGEVASWDEFIEIDKKDFVSGEQGEGRNIQVCLDKADFLIENTGTLEELKEKIENVITKI